MPDILALFPHNNRACVQMLSSEFHHFLNDRKGEGGYRLIEALGLAGFRYPPIIYEYFLAGDQTLNCHYNPDDGVIPYDTRFLPIITRPPAPRRHGRFRAGRYFFADSLLHGLRFLQMLKLLQRSAISDTETTTIEILGDWLEALFEYDTQVTINLCYELDVYGCVRIQMEYPERHFSTDEEVLLMPKGDELISETLWDPAYLNICAMRTLFPREILSTGFFVVESPFTGPDDANRHRVFDRWATAKFCNSVGLARIIHLVNRRQKSAVHKVVGDVCARDLDGARLKPTQIMGIFEPNMMKIGSSLDALLPIYESLDVVEKMGKGQARLSRDKLKATLSDWIER